MIQFFKCLSPEAWVAIIAALIALCTVIFQILEWRNTRFLKGIEMLNSNFDRFSSKEFREKRKVSALYLLSLDIDYKHPPEDLLDLLDFFEGMAYLYTKKVMDAEAIWHSFSAWLLPYYKAAAPAIKYAQKDDNLVFSDLDELFKEIKKFEAKHHPSKDTLHILSQEKVKQFLEGEADY